MRLCSWILLIGYTAIMASVDLANLHAPPVIVVPATKMTLDDYRAWVYSDDFPERGRVTFVNGRVIIDMSPERYDLHVAIKESLNSTLGPLVRQFDRGRYYPDGGLITNATAGVSNEPDALFATWETLESGALAPPAGSVNDDRYMELVGAPDWVCEIVSDSSVEKDTKHLRAAYHKAGIREYWLIDARGEAIDFQLLVRADGGYQGAPLVDGWAYSPVFEREFRLTRERDRLGRWKYDLHHRPRD